MLIYPDIDRRGSSKNEPGNKKIVDRLDEHGQTAGSDDPISSMNASGAFTIQPVELGGDEFCQAFALVAASLRDNSSEGVGASPFETGADHETSDTRPTACRRRHRVLGCIFGNDTKPAHRALG
ncbi:hypothetical protein [Mesorhizobium sp. M0047]|uniref:hypothetical protein n=1 Tax=Mesorhizobium sp. M0047 TaxID=2956859 RepID=UPI00333D863B